MVLFFLFYVLNVIFEFVSIKKKVIKKAATDRVEFESFQSKHLRAIKMAAKPQ